MTEEQIERAAIVRWLNEEADDSMLMLDKYSKSEMSPLYVARASYYWQAASMINRGEHLRLDRPRPTHLAALKPEAGSAGE